MSLGVRGDWLIELCESLEVVLVCVSFAVNLCHDVLVVVVSQSTAQLVVVHVRFVFSLAPSPSNLIRVSQLEFPVSSFPYDTVGVLGVLQQLQQKLPQLNLSTASGWGIWSVT